jgi:hypothetical protein
MAPPGWPLPEPNEPVEYIEGKDMGCGTRSTPYLKNGCHVCSFAKDRSTGRSPWEPNILLQGLKRDGVNRNISMSKEFIKKLGGKL